MDGDFDTEGPVHELRAVTQRAAGIELLGRSCVTIEQEVNLAIVESELVDN